MRPTRWIPLLVLSVLLAACGDSDGSADDTTADGPTIAVTTTILGDVVRELVGDLARVEVIMPPDAGPHDFQPSAQQVDAMTRSDALIANGAGFEEGLEDTIEAVEGDGVPVHEAISAVATIEFGEGGHAENDEHGEDEAHGDGTIDPHFFTDPVRMAEAVTGIATFLTDTVAVLDDDRFRAQVDAYVERLGELDEEVEQLLSPIPDDRRVLVTNHEVFGYFADRYGFEVVGTVIPGGSTNDGAGAGDLAALASLIRSEGVPAIFAESSSPARLAETLAGEVGGSVEVVELYTESLGDEGSGATTYIDMIRINAERVAAALG